MYPKIENKISSHKISRIINSYISGECFTIRSLMEKYNIGYVCITGLFKRFGVEKRTKKEVWANKELLKEKRKRATKYKINESVFNLNRLNPDAVYWIGFLLADGYVTGNRTLGLDLAEKDKNHIYKFRKFLQSNHPVRCYRKSLKNNQKKCCLRISRPNICRSLIPYNIVSRKTFITVFPTNIPPEYYRDFIRGYFDGDGTIHIDKTGNGRMNILGTYPIIKKIQMILVNECGLSMTKLNKEQRVIRGNLFYIQCGGNRQIKKIYNYLYYNGCVCLERKKKIFKKVL